MTPCDAELERVMGIEPTSKAWEAFVLPLNYTRKKKRPLAARSRLSNIRAVLLIEAQIIRLSRFGECDTRRYQNPLLHSANDRPIRLHGTTIHNGTAHHHRATVDVGEVVVHGSHIIMVLGMEPRICS